jgi:glyoxylase-like metal-dependent hydrolase (beta-lactamase superfamily II)
MADELDAAQRRRRGFVASRRYRPSQWDDVTRWRRYDSGGEPWLGFAAVRALDGLPPEVLLLPLPGHTWGHAGIAIDAGGHWLLHAGDAYFYRGEMAPRRRCTPGLRAYQRLMEVDRRARLANQDRLRRLALEKAGEVRVFCAHDPVEFEALQRASEARQPPRA